MINRKSMKGGIAIISVESCVAKGRFRWSFAEVIESRN